MWHGAYHVATRSIRNPGAMGKLSKNSIGHGCHINVADLEMERVVRQRGAHALMRRITCTNWPRPSCRRVALSACALLLAMARLVTAQAADQPSTQPDHLSPKTQGGSSAAMLFTSAIGFVFIIGVPLLTHHWEQRHPRPPVPPQPTVGRPARRVAARCRLFLAAGIGLFVIPMLTFACGIIAAGFNAAYSVSVIMTSGLVLVALDGALLLLLAMAAGVTAIRARRQRSDSVVP